MPATKKFEFKYQGEDSIDLNTLLTSQFHFISILNEIQKESYPQAKINLKVTGFKKGSFVIDMLLETTFIQDLVTPSNVKILGEVLTIFGGLITAYKKLKGKKASEEKDLGNGTVEIKVEGNNNTVILDKRVFNIYKNSVPANEAIKKNFELLEKENSVDGIEIIDPEKKRPIVKVERKDFDKMIVSNDYLSSEYIERETREQTLFIKKPNLFPERQKVWKWSLIYQHRDIEAKITDKVFMQQIDEGLKIGQGDRIIADISIQLRYNDKLRTHLETGRFTVSKIHRIIPREEQFKFELKNT